MAKKSYKERGYNVFEHSGKDIPQNAKFDEFEDILVLEGRNRFSVSWLKIKRRIKRFLIILAVLLILGIYTVATFVGGRMTGGDTNSSPVVVTSVATVLVTEEVFPTQTVEQTQTPNQFPTNTPVQEPTSTNTVEQPATSTLTPVCNVTVISNSDTVNLRSGPSTDYSVARVVSTGSVLTVIATNEQGDWLLVGDNEWISTTITSQPNCP